MKWINVNDKLPKGDIGRYIACFKNKAVMQIHYSEYGNRWWSMTCGDIPKHNPVTHWMPFPDPPKS